MGTALPEQVESERTPSEIEQYDYELPPESIAQSAAEPRDSSRLLVLERDSGKMSHRTFSELAGILRAQDLLVINDTRVMSCRLSARREPSGGRVELLLLREVEAGRWESLAKPAKRLTKGSRLAVEELTATVEECLDDGIRLLSFDGEVRPLMKRVGELPLPPYIGRPGGSVGERYQTIFADKEASAAAPTAGLHFSEALFRDLESSGVGVARVTLEIGWDTFRPLRADHLDDHRMHSERYEVSDDAAARIEECRQRGGRIVAVGTTTTRLLESVADAGGQISPGVGSTDLFIRPGYRFKAVDAMITNFHLPRTTLLMLVAAFAGQEPMMDAYREAILRKYRFYSLGDAMLVH